MVGLFLFCLHPHFVKGILAMKLAFLLGLKEAAKPHQGWLHFWGKRRMQWENLVGHISTACSLPALAPSPYFQATIIRLKCVSVRIACVLITLKKFSGSVSEVLKEDFLTQGRFSEFMTQLTKYLSWLIFSHQPLLTLVVWSTAWHSNQTSAVIFFFPTMAVARYWIRERMRHRLLTQHHSFLLAWEFLQDCHWLLTAWYTDTLWDFASQFQSNVNNNSAIVTLPFPKHCAGRHHTHGHSFISAVFLGLGL